MAGSIFVRLFITAAIATLTLSTARSVASSATILDDTALSRKRANNEEAILKVLSRQGAEQPNAHTVVLENGKTISVSNCLLKKYLAVDASRIESDMTQFGIPESSSKAFTNWITNEAAVPTRATDEVVCISEEMVLLIGKRLGEHIREFIGAEESPMPSNEADLEEVQIEETPQPRAADGSGNSKTSGWAGGVQFVDDEASMTLGSPGECCQCEEETEFVVWENGGVEGCWIGPCCPLLCRSLNSLQVRTSQSVSQCCEESEIPCLADREKASEPGSENWW